MEKLGKLLTTELPRTPKEAEEALGMLLDTYFLVQILKKN